MPVSPGASGMQPRDLSMGFSRQEYWSGLLYPPPGDFPDPGIQPATLTSPVLAGWFFILMEVYLGVKYLDISNLPSKCTEK